MSCAVGCRLSLDPILLGCRLTAVAPIWPLAWELPYTARAALKSKNTKIKNKQNPLKKPTPPKKNLKQKTPKPPSPDPSHRIWEEQWEESGWTKETKSLRTWETSRDCLNCWIKRVELNLVLRLDPSPLSCFTKNKEAVFSLLLLDRKQGSLWPSCRDAGDDF